MRRLAAERVQQGLRFMQIVPDGRNPMQIPLQVRSQGIDPVVDIAIVVVKDIFAPVWRSAEVDTARVGRLIDFVGVIPIDISIAAVEIGRRSDRNNHVIADFPDIRLVGHRKAIAELHHHLTRRCFGAVQTRSEVIVRLG